MTAQCRFLWQEGLESDGANVEAKPEEMGPRKGIVGTTREIREAKYSMHDLRRSCATNLLNQGVPPKTVQKILGHSCIETTMKYYAAVEAKDLRAAIERLEEKTA